MGEHESRLVAGLASMGIYPRRLYNLWILAARVSAPHATVRQSETDIDHIEASLSALVSRAQTAAGVERLDAGIPYLVEPPRKRLGRSVRQRIDDLWRALHDLHAEDAGGIAWHDEVEDLGLALERLSRSVRYPTRPSAARPDAEMQNALEPLIEIAIAAWQAVVGRHEVSIDPVTAFLYAYWPKKITGKLADLGVCTLPPSPPFRLLWGELCLAVRREMHARGIETSEARVGLSARLALWYWLMCTSAEAPHDDPVVTNLVKAVFEKNTRRHTRTSKDGKVDVLRPSHTGYLRDAVEEMPTDDGEAPSIARRRSDAFQSLAKFVNNLDDPHGGGPKLLTDEYELCRDLGSNRRPPEVLSAESREAFYRMFDAAERQLGVLGDKAYGLIWTSKLAYFLPGLLDDEARPEPVLGHPGANCSGLLARIEVIASTPNAMTESQLEALVETVDDLLGGSEDEGVCPLFGRAIEAAMLDNLEVLGDDPRLQSIARMIFAYPLGRPDISEPEPIDEILVYQALLEQVADGAAEYHILDRLSLAAGLQATAAAEDEARGDQS